MKEMKAILGSDALIDVKNISSSDASFRRVFQK